MVIVLEGHRKGLLVVGGVGEPSFAVLGEAEIGRLVAYHRLAFACRIEAVGHTFVVGSHLKTNAVAEPQIQLTVFNL